MSVALDFGFPVSANPPFATVFTSADSASITTPGTNRLLVVVAHWALNSATTIAAAPLSCAGAGLTWTKLKEVSVLTSGAFPTGALAIFYAFAPSVVTAQTITVTRNSSDGKNQSAVVTVYSFSGASGTQTGATAGHAASASSNRSDSITTSAGSWVVGGVGDTGVAGGSSLTQALGCTPDKEILDSTNGDSYDCVSYRGAPGGAITVGFTGTDDSLYVALAEIVAEYSLSENAPADVVFDAYGPIRFLSQTAFQPNAFQDNAFQVYGGTTGGANNFNESDTPSALAQDILLAAQGFAQPDSYSALAQDQELAALGWNAVISEASLAQDLLNGAQGAPGSLSELVTTALQLATAQAMLAAFSENAPAQDVALPALQMPVGMSEFSLSDVLFDSTLLRPGSGSQYDESLIEACIAQDALAGALGAGGGVEAKIGGAAATASTSIFIFDD